MSSPTNNVLISYFSSCFLGRCQASPTTSVCEVCCSACLHSLASNKVRLQLATMTDGKRKSLTVLPAQAHRLHHMPHQHGIQTPWLCFYCPCSLLILHQLFHTEYSSSFRGPERQLSGPLAKGWGIRMVALLKAWSSTHQPGAGYRIFIFIVAA